MKNRFAQLILFLIPVSLLFGERAAFELFKVPFYWFEILTVAFLIVAWSAIRRKGLQRLLNLPVAVRWGALLLIPALIISCLVATQTGEALGAAKAWFIAPMLLATFFIASGEESDGLLYGIVLAALMQVFYGFQVLPMQEEQRLLGTFTSANFFAAVVVPAAFLSLLFPMKGKGFVPLILIWGLFMSQSLGGFLGLIGGAVYLGITQVKVKWARWSMIAVVVGAAVIGGYLAYQRFNDNPRSSLASRKEIWQVAWRLGEDNPLTGVGLRNFDNAYLKEVPSLTTDPIEWNVPEPHNLYLAFWLDLSLLGFIAMILLIGGSIAAGGVASAAVVALLVHGLVDTPIFKLELAVLFWLYLAIVLVRARGGSRTANLVR